MVFLDGENKKLKTACNFFFSVYKQMYASPGQENHSFIKLTYLRDTN